MIGETRSTFTMLTFVNLFNMINLIRVDFDSLAIYWVFLIAAIATLLALASYITSVIMPQKAQELLEEIYPEYKIVNSL